MNSLLTYNSYGPDDHKHYEGAYTQGNGYMNVRASFEEDLHEATQNDKYWRLPANVTLEKGKHLTSKWGTYVPGIYGTHPILGEEIVNLPYAIGVNLYHEGVRLDMEQSHYSQFHRSLNMQDGVLKRSLVWHTDQGDIQVEFERYCSLVNKHVIVQKIQLTSTQAAKVTFESFIDAGVTTNGYNHFTSVRGSYQNGLIVAVTTDSKQEVGIHSYCEGEGEGLESLGCSGLDKQNRIKQSFSVSLHSGQTVSICKYVVIATSLDEGYEGNILEHLARISAESNGCKFAYDEHQALWAKKWKQSDIVIEGDDKLQESVRFSIYHLLRSVNDSDHVAIDAKGYAGEAYFGHYFWDTEIYLLPFFIYTQPEYAKKLITYRYKTLQGAKANAKRYGYQGARYPWESCITGTEQCSNWQYADLEVHVTADVIYGLWHYYEATKDEAFLLGQGLEMMVETARYWASRVDRKHGEYHLMGVMGPDEYLPFTNNNAFTNYMVKFALTKTIETLTKAQAQQSELIDKLQVTAEEVSEFKEIADKLVFNYDSEKKFIPQCDSFDEFLDVDFDQVWTDRSKPFGHFISQEKNYRSKALKQADVIALLYLFRDRFDETTKKNCLDYYNPITTHDSSLSYIIHSLIHQEIGEVEQGYAFLEKSLDIDLGRKGAAEGIHIANCGGIWQGIVMGLGGFRGVLDQNQLTVHAALPPHISKLTYQICVHGVWYQVIAEQTGTRIEQI